MKASVSAKLNTGFAWVLLVLLIAPALVAIPVSLTPKTFLSFPTDELSLQYYRELFSSDLDWHTLRHRPVARVLSDWRSHPLCLASSPRHSAHYCRHGLFAAVCALGAD